MQPKQRFLITVASSLALLAALPASPKPTVSRTDYRSWRVYGGGPDNIHYSTLNQINRSNVHKLEVAWTYDTGDAFPDSEMECNPIIVHAILFATTPKLRVIALEAETGKLRWSFNPNEGTEVTGHTRNRGLTYWEEGKDQRIYFVTDHDLYALEARTG